MAVPAVWRLINVLAFIEPKQHAELTGGTPVLLSQNPKASCFWYNRLLSSRLEAFYASTQSTRAS